MLETNIPYKSIIMRCDVVNHNAFSEPIEEEYKRIYNEGYHEMREALDIKPYDFIQDNSFFIMQKGNI